jgi:hypothetical protein
MTRAFESDECTLVRHNLLVLAVVSAMPVAWGIIKLLLGRATAWEVAVWAAVMGSASLWLAYGANWRPVLRPVRVRADSRGVMIGGRFIARSTIQRAYGVPGSPAGVVLHVRGFRLPIQIRVGSVGEARELLDAVDGDGTRRVVELAIGPGVLVDLRWAFLLIPLMAVQFFLTLKLDLRMVDWATFILIWIPSLRLIQQPTWLRVGADGITLAWLWRRRFIGFDAMTSIDRCETERSGSRTAGLRIPLASGQDVVLPVPDESELARVEARMQEAILAFRMGSEGGGGPYRSSKGAPSAVFLQRRGRALAEWVAALRGLGAGATAMPTERLFRIVESPAAEGVDRVAAAVALAGAPLDEPTRMRLLAVAESVAAPKLRVALEKAVHAVSEAEREAALAEACAGEPRRLRARR